MTYAKGTLMEARGLHGDAIYLVVKGLVAIVSLPVEEGEAAPGTAEAAAKSCPGSGGPEHDFCLEGDMPGMAYFRNGCKQPTLIKCGLPWMRPLIC